MRTRRSKRFRGTKGRRFHIVVTAGPTREFFDSVRFVSNPSSGKMGYAVAAAAAAAGHRVTLISGPVWLAPPAGVKTIRVVSAAEMAEETKQAFKTANAAVFTAAVCDYRPRRRLRQKLAKQPVSKTVVFVPTEDISASIGRIKGDRITIAFAMEDHAARNHAERKLIRKQCDAIVLNGPANVGADRAQVDYLEHGGRWEQWPAASKAAVARRIVSRLEALLASTSS